jgi:hypothetical protein
MIQTLADALRRAMWRKHAHPRDDLEVFETGRPGWRA